MTRHRLDRLALLAGALFAQLGLWFLLGSPDVLRWDPGAVWTVVAVVAALLLLVPRRPDRRERP